MLYYSNSDVTAIETGESVRTFMPEKAEKADTYRERSANS